MGIPALLDILTSMTEEIRIHDEKTGAQKGSKVQRFDLIPTGAITELATHYGRGAEKYPDEDGIPNYRRGYDWNLSYAAAQRHMTQFWAGEDRDEETGSKHVIAAAWHMFTLATFMDEYPEGDNRWTTARRQLPRFYEEEDWREWEEAGEGLDDTEEDLDSIEDNVVHLPDSPSQTARTLVRCLKCKFTILDGDRCSMCYGLGVD